MSTEPLPERETRTKREAAGDEVRNVSAFGDSPDRERSRSGPLAAGAEGFDSSAEENQRELVQAVAARDERTCRALIRRYHASMVQVARGFVRNRAVAEEVAQETWVAMLQGLEGFRGNSSVKTWLFSILIRRARAVGVREGRTAALSQLGTAEPSDECDPMERFFHPKGHPDAGGWAVPPQRWRRNPEDEALARELRQTVAKAVCSLPEAQQVVVKLRDGQGWEAGEIAELLERTPNWVRVNLHRARLKIRLAVARRLGAQELK